MDNIVLTQFFEQHYWLLILIALWTLPWKGVALWKAAHNKHTGWFVAMLILNTLAILEITYIFYFSDHALAHAKGDREGSDVEK